MADEPRAVLAGREILSAGGTAADAAAAVGLTLAVTLSFSRRLGRRGRLHRLWTGSAKPPARGVPEAVMFTPIAPANAGIAAPTGPRRCR